MMPNDKGSSAKIALWYRDVPITPEVLKTLKGKITKECWKYLLGKTCLAEKNKRGNNERIGDIYKQIGKDFGYAYPSMKDYICYSYAIDRLYKLLPDIALTILNGASRISQKDSIILAKMEFPEIRAVMKRVANESTLTRIIINEQKALRKTEQRGKPQKSAIEAPRISVKDMPTYDPNAQFNGLAYTIPSWVSMIERAFAASDFNKVSPSSQNRLIEELKKLTTAAETMTALLSEGK